MNVMAFAIICNSLDVAKYLLLAGWDIESSVDEVTWIAPLLGYIFLFFDNRIEKLRFFLLSVGDL